MIGGSSPGRGWEVFFTTASRPDLGPTQPPIERVPRALSLWIKRPGREAEHSPPSSAEVKEWAEQYLHSPICLNDVVLSLKHRDTFTLYLYAAFIFRYIRPEDWCIMDVLNVSTQPRHYTASQPRRSRLETPLHSMDFEPRTITDKY
jgi:hypothetical protein